MNVGNESMIDICLRNTEKGNLPHLSYILHKTGPVVKELNSLDCSVTETLIFIEIQIGK